MLRILLLIPLLTTLHLCAESDLDPEHEARVVEAVEKGLGYLARTQSADGSFTGGQYSHVQAALASMAFMASGHFAGRGKYGQNFERAVLWLVKRQDKRGYFGLDGGRMYGHGMCTLALSEAYGMLRNRKDNQKVQKALQKAINLICASQAKGGRNNGGWRYEPRPNDADLSVTAWQVQALRGAQNCQITIPADTINRAIDYIRRCYHRGQKGYSYSPGGGPNMPMRCAGVVIMHTLKEGEQEQVKEAGQALLKQSFNRWGGSYFYYQSYYAATAGLMVGDEGRKRINEPLEKVLLPQQRQDGSWPPAPSMGGGQSAGPVYFTSFACLILAARYEYLPIYQE